MSLFDLASQTEGQDDSRPAIPFDALPQVKTGRPAFDPAFDAAAKEYGVDADILRGLAFAESRFRPDVIDGTVKSPKGAIGLLQFMPDTAKEHGINPLDPVEAIFGAAAYIRKSMDRFGGDVEKAVASYNAGPNRYAFKADEWKPRMPKETRAYLETVLGFADGQRAQREPQKDLPEGVEPSTAEAGRGSINPEMPTGAPKQPETSTFTTSGSIFDKVAMQPPTEDAAKNRAAMESSVSPDSVMFTAGRGAANADRVIAAGQKRQALLKRAGFDSEQEFRDAEADRIRREKFTQDNPLTASLGSGVASQTAGILNSPQVAAEFLNKTFIDPVLKAVGKAPMPGAPQTPGTGALMRMASDYMPAVGRKSFEDVVGTDQFQPWLLSNMAQNSPQMVMQLAAALVPPLRATILPSMGAATAGQQYLQGDDARVAMAKGLIEVGTEMLPLGVFDKIKDTLMSLPRGAQRTFLAEAGKRVLAGTAAVAGQHLTEGSEEWISQVAQNALDRYVQGKDTDLTSGAAGAYVVGGAMGGAMGAPHLVTALRDNSPQAQAERELARNLNEGQFKPLPDNIVATTNPNLVNVAPKVEDQPTTPVVPQARPAAAPSVPVSDILATPPQQTLAERAEAQTKAPDASNAVEAAGAVQPGVAGRSADAGGSEPAGGLADVGLAAAGQPAGSVQPAAPVDGAGAAASPVAATGPKFPILKGYSGDTTMDSIPLSLLAEHEAQAQRNHQQSLNELARRGGLSPREALAVILDRRISDGAIRNLTMAQVETALKGLIAKQNEAPAQEKQAQAAPVEAPQVAQTSAAVDEGAQAGNDTPAERVSDGVLYAEKAAAQSQTQPVTGQAAQVSQVSEAVQEPRDLGTSQGDQRHAAEAFQNATPEVHRGEAERLRAAADKMASFPQVAQSYRNMAEAHDGIANTKESAAPADEQDRHGLRAEDRYLRSVASAAGELAMQVEQNSAEDDFDPKELPQALEQWAKDANVAADDLRAAFKKEIEGRSFRRKAGVLAAIDPTKQTAEAKPAEKSRSEVERQVIELRKRKAVLESLRACLGA